MKKELAAMFEGSREQAYFREIRRRDRAAAWATNFRFLAVHLSWIIVLVAGAAVSLAGALDLSSWIAPLLGFVIVVFQGFDRLFDRTSVGAQAVDALSRGLTREQRLMLIGGGKYAGESTPPDRVKLFVERSEELLSDYDKTMVKYFATLTRTQESQ